MAKEVTDRAAAAATSPGLKLPKPQEGVAVDIKVWIKKVSKPLRALDQARKDVAKEEREAQITGSAKARATTTATRARTTRAARRTRARKDRRGHRREEAAKEIVTGRGAAKPEAPRATPLPQRPGREAPRATPLPQRPGPEAPRAEVFRGAAEG